MYTSASAPETTPPVEEGRCRMRSLCTLPNAGHSYHMSYLGSPLRSSNCDVGNRILCLGLHFILFHLIYHTFHIPALLSLPASFVHISSVRIHRKNLIPYIICRKKERTSRNQLISNRNRVRFDKETKDVSPTSNSSSDPIPLRPSPGRLYQLLLALPAFAAPDGAPLDEGLALGSRCHHHWERDDGNERGVSSSYSGWSAEGRTGFEW